MTIHEPRSPLSYPPASGHTWVTCENLSRDVGELVMDGIMRRRRWITHRNLDDWKVSETAFALQISEGLLIVGGAYTGKMGGRRWSSNRPHRFWRTPRETVDLILRIRKCQRLGPCKIEGYLRNYGGEDVITVGHNTIHRTLVARLNSRVEAPRKVWDKRRDPRGSRTRRLGVHRVLHWKRHTAHNSKYMRTLNSREDRSISQSIRL